MGGDNQETITTLVETTIAKKECIQKKVINGFARAHIKIAQMGATVKIWK